MEKTFSFILILYSFVIQAQTTVTFEEFGLSANVANVDAGASGVFGAGNITLPNDYDAGYDSWTGWAVSTITDNNTPGFMNDESAITGSGFASSATYAVSFSNGPNTLNLVGDASGGVVNGLYVTNGTYPYFSMLEGDGFAKKFGGEDGNDPDFFLLTIKGMRNGMKTADSVNFYLADYRFENNTQDYIVNGWEWIDLTSLGPVDQLSFSLSSTDNGQFGMNTPAYFCVDNVSTADGLTGTTHILSEKTFSIFPNPAAEVLTVNWGLEVEASLSIRSLDGRTLVKRKLINGKNKFQLNGFPSGAYFAEIHSEGQKAGKIILKK